MPLFTLSTIQIHQMRHVTIQKHLMMARTPDVAVVTPLNNFLGPEGDTVTVDEQLLNTEY